MEEKFAFFDVLDEFVYFGKLFNASLDPYKNGLH